jgi:hypothetical protein
MLSMIGFVYFLLKSCFLTGSVCFVEFQLPLWLCMMMGPCALLLHVHDVLLCVDLVFKKQQLSPSGENGT